MRTWPAGASISLIGGADEVHPLARAAELDQALADDRDGDLADGVTEASCRGRRCPGLRGRRRPRLVNTLMTSRGHSLITVRFRPDSPNLAATIPLEALSDEEATAAFLNVLKDLASGASASRQ